MSTADKPRKYGFLLIDYQNDFCEGGSLPVTGARALRPKVEQLLKLPFAVKLASADFHPLGHVSFAGDETKIGDPVTAYNPFNREETEVLRTWPVHCVQHTSGSAFLDGLDISAAEWVIFKGTHAEMEEYSAFGSTFSNPKPPRPRLRRMSDYLRRLERAQSGSTSESHGSRLDESSGQNRSRKTLPEFLEDNGITDLVLAGVAADVCVEATARDALALGWGVQIVRDGCAAVQPTDEYWSKIPDIFPTYVAEGRLKLVTADEVEAELEGQARSR